MWMSVRPTSRSFSIRCAPFTFSRIKPEPTRDRIIGIRESCESREAAAWRLNWRRVWASDVASSTHCPSAGLHSTRSRTTCAERSPTWRKVGYAEADYIPCGKWASTRLASEFLVSSKYVFYSRNHNILRFLHSYHFFSWIKVRKHHSAVHRTKIYFLITSVVFTIWAVLELQYTVQYAAASPLYSILIGCTGAARNKLCE